LNLLNSLRTLGKGLLAGDFKKTGKIERDLNKTLLQLKIIKSRYSNRKLKGTDNVADLMEEGINLYIEAISDFMLFFKDKDREHISEGLFKAEEADDILLSIEDIILQNKEKFKELSLS